MRAFAARRPSLAALLAFFYLVGGLGGFMVSLGLVNGLGSLLYISPVVTLPTVVVVWWSSMQVLGTFQG